MTKSQKEWWEQERARGYDRFLLRRLLRAGVPFGVIVVGVKLLYSFFNGEAVDSVSRILIEFAFYVVAFGGVMGVLNLQSNEREYGNATEDEDTA